ncbi:DUF4439 domain-containing protein [Pseudarthrobacter sp. J1763]|uniref:DUF4439 domain-containing protein n=1 Tax=Pseudarthrobacter sp. J1763 TaxID=3420445 RepID=UPI003D2AE9A8
MNTTASNKRRFALWKCLVLFASVAMVTVSVGTFLTRPAHPLVEPLSTPETQRLAALNESRELSLESRAWAQDKSTALDALTRSSWQEMADLLEVQARALLHPNGPEFDQERFDAGLESNGSTPSPTAFAAKYKTPGELVVAIRNSGANLLKESLGQEPGMARTFASAGVSRSFASVTLAKLAKLSNVSDPRFAGFTKVPACSGTPVAAPAATGAAAAIASAVQSEQRSIYLYQVALTRLAPEMQNYAQKGLTAHQETLQQALALATAQCVIPSPAQPGYALPSGFTADPVQGLAGVEKAALEPYVDAVALSEGSTREWAESILYASYQRSSAWAGTQEALPGLNVDVKSLPALPSFGP